MICPRLLRSVATVGPASGTSMDSKSKGSPMLATGRPSIHSMEITSARYVRIAACPSPKLRPAGKLVDLSTLIRRELQFDDHPPAPPASTPPLPLRRPPPPRPREPRLAPATRRVQEN